MVSNLVFTADKTEIGEQQSFSIRRSASDVGNIWDASLPWDSLSDCIMTLTAAFSTPAGQTVRGAIYQVRNISGSHRPQSKLQWLNTDGQEYILSIFYDELPYLTSVLTDLAAFEGVALDLDMNEMEWRHFTANVLKVIDNTDLGTLEPRVILLESEVAELDTELGAVEVLAQSAADDADAALIAAAAAQTTANGRATVASVTAAQSAADAAQSTATAAGIAAGTAQTTANAAAAAVLALPTTDLGNRIPNSKLGDVVSGLPALWSRSGNPAAINAVTIPEIPGTVWKLDGASSQIGVLSSWFDVTPGEVLTYLLTYRGSLTGTATGVARIEWQNTAGTGVGFFSQNLTLPGAANASTPLVVPVPADAVKARVFILHASAATAGSWYVRASILRRTIGSEVLGTLQFPGLSAVAGVTKVVTSDDATGIDGNFYGSGYRTPSGFGLTLGSRAIPVTDARPVLWAEKFSSANRNVNASEWDQGGGYFALEKRAGDAYGAALTGYGRHESTDGGDLIGVHARASAYQTASKVWGLWAYAHAGDPAKVPVSIIGIEVNLNSRIPDQGYSPATGYSTGLLVVTQDASLPVSKGIEVGRGTAAPNGHFHTGLKFRRDSILPSGVNSSTAITDNEAVLIEGAASVGNGANGIRFGFGNYRTGLVFSEATISDNAAIVLGEGHRIIVGPGASVTSYAEFSRTNSFFNLSNLNLHINGLKVLGARNTGWTAVTGTPLKGGFDVSTGTLAQALGMLKAIYDALGPSGHNMIGT